MFEETSKIIIIDLGPHQDLVFLHHLVDFVVELLRSVENVTR